MTFWKRTILLGATAWVVVYLLIENAEAIIQGWKVFKEMFR